MEGARAGRPLLAVGRKELRYIIATTVELQGKSCDIILPVLSYVQRSARRVAGERAAAQA